MFQPVSLKNIKNKYKIAFSANIGLTTESFTSKYIEKELAKIFSPVLSLRSASTPS
jgi:hypothetical protein